MSTAQFNTMTRIYEDPDKPPVSLGDAINASPLLRSIQTQTDIVSVKCGGLPITDDNDRIRGREECNAVIEIEQGLANMTGNSLCCDNC